jgi:CheY-like chemotaxis protein
MSNQGVSVADSELKEIGSRCVDIQHFQLRYVDHRHAPKTGREPSSIPVLGRVEGRHFGVLVADDSDDDRFLLERALRRCPCLRLVGMVDDGEAAIKYLAGAGKYGNRWLYPYPHLLMLDLNMPRRTGFDVLHWLSGQQARPHVVMLTTSDDPIERSRALSLGADAFETKPAELPALADLLRRIEARLAEGPAFRSDRLNRV